jgi:hypothetical protein
MAPLCILPFIGQAAACGGWRGSPLPTPAASACPPHYPRQEEGLEQVTTRLASPNYFLLLTRVFINRMSSLSYNDFYSIYFFFHSCESNPLPRIELDFPQLGEVQLKAPLVRLPRLCLSFLLLVEYKLSQHQLRSQPCLCLSSAKGICCTRAKRAVVA